jgi:endogenous inhibitor of DNA gyrase (YacG/DUF329 family)
MKALTIDQEQALLERLSRNKHDAEMRRLLANARRTEALDPLLNPFELHCVVCGAAMKAQRRSKKTCSSRCRLRLSRWLRAYFALPEAERRKREDELQKRWKRAAAAAKSAEKRKPKRSLAQLTADNKATLSESRA